MFELWLRAGGIRRRQIKPAIGGICISIAALGRSSAFRHGCSIHPVRVLSASAVIVARMGTKTQPKPDYSELWPCDGLVKKDRCKNQERGPRHDQQRRKRLDTIFHEYANGWRRGLD